MDNKEKVFLIAIKKLVKILEFTKKYRRYFFISAFFLVIRALLELLTPLLWGRVIKIITDSSSLNDIIPYIGYFAIIYILI